MKLFAFIKRITPAFIKIKAKKYIAYYRQFTIKKDIFFVEPITSNKVCLFAHYDGNGKVCEYVYNYLKEIKKNGYDIIFVSTASITDNKYKTRLKEFCKIALCRTNIGIDFYSWKVALKYIKDLNSVDTLLITNDSMYGPIFDLKPIFDEMSAKNFDIWGMTDSWQNHFHLQSYFLVVNKKVITSEFFINFWKNVLPYTDKWKIIFDYEIGFSKEAWSKEFVLGSYVRYLDVIERILKEKNYQKYVSYLNENRMYTEAVNPSILFWYEIVKYFKFPFIKSYIFRYNPYRATNLDLLPKLCKEFNYPIELIKEHLGPNLIKE